MREREGKVKGRVGEQVDGWETAGWTDRLTASPLAR